MLAHIALLASLTSQAVHGGPISQLTTPKFIKLLEQFGYTCVDEEGNPSETNANGLVTPFGKVWMGADVVKRSTDADFFVNDVTLSRNYFMLYRPPKQLIEDWKKHTHSTIGIFQSVSGIVHLDCYFDVYQSTSDQLQTGIANCIQDIQSFENQVLQTGKWTTDPAGAYFRLAPDLDEVVDGLRSEDLRYLGSWWGDGPQPKVSITPRSTGWTVGSVPIILIDGLETTARDFHSLYVRWKIPVERVSQIAGWQPLFSNGLAGYEDIRMIPPNESGDAFVEGKINLEKGASLRDVQQRLSAFSKFISSLS